MVDRAPHADASRIDALLEAGDLAGARAALIELGEAEERLAVVRIKLGLLERSLPTGAAMQQLIQLMRRDEGFPGAKELYQEASRLAYEQRQSTSAHSHPPPPTTRRRSE